MCEIKRLRDMEPGDRFLCTLPNLLGECVLLEHRDDQLSGVRCLGNEKANIVCSNTSVVVCTERDELAEKLEYYVLFAKHVGWPDELEMNRASAIANGNSIHSIRHKYKELRPKYDELAAELERVKAERDELKANSFSDDLKTMSILAETDQHIKDCKTFLEEFKKLSSLKSRLPVNADGDVVIAGDTHWVDLTFKSPFEVRIIYTQFTDAWSVFCSDGHYYFMDDLRSTKDTCRAFDEVKDEE